MPDKPNLRINRSSLVTSSRKASLPPRQGAVNRLSRRDHWFTDLRCGDAGQSRQLAPAAMGWQSPR